jgi:hypothetical protein
MPHKKYHKTKCNCINCRNSRKRTCKHKRYKGGDGDMPAPQPPTQPTATKESSNKESWFGNLPDISKLFESSPPPTTTQPPTTPPTPPQPPTGGKRRRNKRTKKNRRTKKRKY